MGDASFVAWIGAITGCLSLAFGIVRWRLESKTRLRISITPNRTYVPLIPQTPSNQDGVQILSAEHGPEETVILVTVQNVGHRPTTISDCYGAYYKNRFNFRAGRKPVDDFSVLGRGVSKEVPFVLHPGEEWSWHMRQSDAQERMGRTVLALGVLHSTSEKPAVAAINVDELGDETHGSKS